MPMGTWGQPGTQVPRFQQWRLTSFFFTILVKTSLRITIRLLWWLDNCILPSTMPLLFLGMRFLSCPQEGESHQHARLPQWNMGLSSVNALPKTLFEHSFLKSRQLSLPRPLWWGDKYRFPVNSFRLQQRIQQDSRKHPGHLFDHVSFECI